MSISPGKSCPSPTAIGHTSVTHYEGWYNSRATAGPSSASGRRSEEAKKLARGDAGQPLTIRVAIERDYAGHIKTNGSSPGNVTRLLHHLPDDLANKPIGLATERDYARWVHSLLASGLARGTVRRTKVNLQAALELAVRLNPALAVYRNTWKTGLSGVSDVHNPRDVFLTVKEVGRLETAAHEVGGERFRNYVCAHYETAARSSQLARVQCGDLQADHPDGPRLLVPRSKKGRNGTRKTGEKIAVPITRGLAERLRVANAGRGATEPLFLRSDNRPWNPSPRGSFPAVPAGRRARRVGWPYNLQFKAFRDRQNVDG